MKTLKTSEAAALLCVSPNTLRVWERRFGFPDPQRSPGKHRLYAQAEILALRDALQDGLTISSAIGVARDSFGAEVQALYTRLTSFCTEDADEVMRRTLAMRTIEKSIEDVLLPALLRIHTRKGFASPVSVFAMDWACDWLHRVRRATALAADGQWILICDVSTPILDPMRPYIAALEVLCARANLVTLTVPLSASVRLSEAVRMIEPELLVVAGRRRLDPEAVRWITVARSAWKPVPVFLYHYDVTPGLPRAGPLMLPASPLAAQRALAQALAQQQALDDDKRGAPPSSTQERSA